MGLYKGPILKRKKALRMTGSGKQLKDIYFTEYKSLTPVNIDVMTHCITDVKTKQQYIAKFEGDNMERLALGIKPQTWAEFEKLNNL
jgi:hypothetical protein